MSKSVLLKSSLAKKYWMALTGLFLCTFLIGHLLGNLQLFAGGEEGKRAFNEYGYFMSHNIFIKILSYTTYVSILFHAIDGFLLAFQNKKARPVNYAYSKPSANSGWASRSMALLGSIILIFICTHMANFWWKAKYSSTPMPLHRVEVSAPGSEQKQSLYLTTTGSFLPTEGLVIKHGTQIYAPEVNLKVGEGYKDLHSLTVAFFGHDKSKEGFPANEFALLAVVLYSLAMLTLSFHLWHGFSSAFQTLGVRHPKYTPLIQMLGKGFAVLVPLGFASIPIFLYLTK
jgi:succinate dehydrogenase / fumarate reductase cytochrome b subunit